MRRILVLGYYGFGNFGDEIILSAVQSELAAVDCEAAFAVHKPTQYGSQSCPRHSLVDRDSAMAMSRALRSSECVMLGGGGLIQDATSWRSSLYYLGIPFLGAVERKALVSYAQGIGPISSLTTRHLVGRVFDRMKLIDVRDAESRSLLVACGVRSQNIHVSCDAGLSFLVAAHGPLLPLDHHTPVIIACVNGRFGWSSENTASFLDCLASYFAARVNLVVLFPKADLDFTREVQKRLLTGSDVIVSPSAQDLLQLCDMTILTVAGRYHMAVAAVASRSPLIALAYDPKLLNLAHALGFGAIVPEALPEVAARFIIDTGVRSVAEEAIGGLGMAREQRILRLQAVLAGETP